jgi:hypothetical protein
MANKQEPKKTVAERLRRNIGPVARKAGTQIGKAWQATTKAAERTTKVVALRAKVSARELEIRGLFYRIGEAFYRAQKAGKDATENAALLRPMTEQVDKLKREISSLKQQEKKARAGK